MRTLVRSEMAAVCTSVIAFVAGVWTLAGMRTLVCSEMAVSCTSIIAFIAGERALA